MTLIFREKVFSLLQDAHFLSPDFATKMRQWSPSGFSVYQSCPVSSGDDHSTERLAQYIARAPFALNKLSYDPWTGVVRYLEGGQETTFDPLEFILLLQRHIPNKGEILIRYYGWYANASRGKRNPAPDENDDQDRAELIVQDDCPEKKECRKRWAAMIKKIYEKDPLICPRCGAEMRIIAFIDKWETILRILKHLKLWPVPPRDPPRRVEAVETIPQQQSIFTDFDFFGS